MIKKNVKFNVDDDTDFTQVQNPTIAAEPTNSMASTPVIITKNIQNTKVIVNKKFERFTDIELQNDKLIQQKIGRLNNTNVNNNNNNNNNSTTSGSSSIHVNEDTIDLFIIFIKNLENLLKKETLT